MLVNKRRIGVTGFEPATSRPPAVRSSQAEPHPVQKIFYHIVNGKASIFLHKIRKKFHKDSEKINEDFLNCKIAHCLKIFPVL